VVKREHIFWRKHLIACARPCKKTQLSAFYIIVSSTTCQSQASLWQKENGTVKLILLHHTSHTHNYWTAPLFDHIKRITTLALVTGGCQTPVNL
jgi:hypothetical protein